MLKKEIFDTLKSAKARCVMLVFVLVPLGEFFYKLYWQYQVLWFHPEFYPNGLADSEIYHPSMAGYLSGGLHTSNFQYILFWLLPIWGLLLYGDAYIRENRCGYIPVMHTRISRKKFFWTKNLAAFLLGSVIGAGSLLLNYVLCLVAFRGSSFHNLETYVGIEGMPEWFDFSMRHPIGIYLLYIFIYAVLLGLIFCMCTSLSMAFSSYKLTYSIAFLLWFSQMCTKYRVMNIVQPFTELRSNVLVPGALIFCVAVVASVIAGYFRSVKCDIL